MAHDAYVANLLRLRVWNHLESLQIDEALVAADKAIAYAALSLPRNPLAGSGAVDAQALFDWAVGLEMRGITHRHRNDISRSMQDLNDAEKAMMLILAQFPMDENYSALAQIFHNRGNSRLTAGDASGAAHDATQAIKIRRKLANRNRNEAELLAGTLKARSDAFLREGQRTAALEDATEAVSIRREALPANPDPKHRHTFAMTVYTLAATQADAGDARGACESVREAITVLEEILHRHPSPTAQQDLSTCRALEKRICR
jgi:tetratricopeptide (TPR) repeat protein